MSRSSSHETRLAVIERPQPDLLLVRYREGITFSSEGIAEVIAACEQLTDGAPFGLVSILPGSGDMSLDAMQQEHSTEGFGRQVRAHAIVPSDNLFKRLSEIHYDYHPQQHDVRMFATEGEAVEWVRAMLEE